MGITASAPFRGVDDENLAIAYISTLILVFFVRCVFHLSALLNTTELAMLTPMKVTLFPLGGFLIIAKDFDGQNVESEELRERMRLRRHWMVTKAVLFLRRLPLLRRNPDKVDTICEAEIGGDPEKETISCTDECTVVPSIEHPTIHIETADSRESTGRKTPTATSPTSAVNPDDDTLGLPEITQGPTSRRSPSQSHPYLKRFVAELLKPAPIVIVFAIVTALVDPLKALFLPPSANFQPRFRPLAPDGQPPLAFILDTASFVGAASVPIG